jgi:hypothetical protein
MDENPYEPSQSAERRVRPSQGGTLNARELFGVVVRGIGVYLIAYAAWSAAGTFIPDRDNPPLYYFMWAIPPLVVGGVLLLAAESIVSFAYGPRNEYDHDEGEDVQDQANEEPR